MSTVWRGDSLLWKFCAPDHRRADLSRAGEIPRNLAIRRHVGDQSSSLDIGDASTSKVGTGQVPRPPAVDMIRLIAALDVQRGIAVDSGIPWTIPSDTAHFHDETKSGLIVMGWNTYTEFAKPLHDRTNYVVTPRSETLRDGFLPVGGVAQLRSEFPKEDVWVIGGAAVFEATIQQAGELLLTQVLSDFHCTKFFPPYVDQFTLSIRGPDSQDRGVSYRFETWRRSRGLED